MDFIVKLPKSGKYDMILTIMDHDCSKSAIFNTLPGKQLLRKESQDCTSDTYIQDWNTKEDYLRPRFLIYLKVCQGTSSSLQIHQNISTATIHKPMDNRNEQISG